MGWFDYRPFQRTRKNKVLPQGVLSVDAVSGKFKIGDNRTLWNDLPELGGSGGGGGTGAEGGGNNLVSYTFDKNTPGIFDGTADTGIVIPSNSFVDAFIMMVPEGWPGGVNLAVADSPAHVMGALADQDGGLNVAMNIANYWQAAVRSNNEDGLFVNWNVPQIFTQSDYPVFAGLDLSGNDLSGNDPVPTTFYLHWLTAL